MANGYTTLSINGKKVGLKFGLEALYMIHAKMEKMNKIPKVGGMFDLMTLSYYAYAGYYCNCIIKDAEEEYSYENFLDYFEEKRDDEKFAEEVIEMMDIFNKSIATFTVKNIDKVEADEKKNLKKSTGKKSKGTVLSLD